MSDTSKERVRCVNRCIRKTVNSQKKQKDLEKKNSKCTLATMFLPSKPFKHLQLYLVPRVELKHMLLYIPHMLVFPTCSHFWFPVDQSSTIGNLMTFRRFLRSFEELKLNLPFSGERHMSCSPNEMAEFRMNSYPTGQRHLSCSNLHHYSLHLPSMENYMLTRIQLSNFAFQKCSEVLKRYIKLVFAGEW